MRREPHAGCFFKQMNGWTDEQGRRTSMGTFAVELDRHQLFLCDLKARGCESCNLGMRLTQVARVTVTQIVKSSAVIARLASARHRRLLVSASRIGLMSKYNSRKGRPSPRRASPSAKVKPKSPAHDVGSCEKHPRRRDRERRHSCRRPTARLRSSTLIWERGEGNVRPQRRLGASRGAGVGDRNVAPWRQRSYASRPFFPVKKFSRCSPCRTTRPPRRWKKSPMPRKCSPGCE